MEHNFSLIFNERQCSLLQELQPPTLTPNTFPQLRMWNEAFFPSASSCIFSVCSVFPLTKDHYRSVESDIAAINLERLLCGEHLVPKKTRCYFPDGFRRMSGFDPPVSTDYFLNFIPTHRRWMLPGSHGIALASALPELAFIS